MSQDGRNWARIEADHHTGALFDAGEEGEWDQVLNAKPQATLPPTPTVAPLAIGCLIPPHLSACCMCEPQATVVSLHMLTMFSVLLLLKLNCCRHSSYQPVSSKSSGHNVQQSSL